MSKVSNALNMLALLKSRGQMTRSEIAEILECDKREVSRYKDDLYMAGVRIKEIRGRNGGYVLEGKDYLLSLDLTDGEYAALNMAQEQLKREEFLVYKDFKKALLKINALRDKHTDISTSKYYIKNIKSNFDYEEERKIWLDINAAIIASNKVHLKYEGAHRKITERTVRPYALFQYKGDMYFVGYCELRNESRQFKLSRIKNYEVTKEKFDKDKNFSLEEYLQNNFGIYKDGQVELKLKIYYPMAQIIKEKQRVKNEKIEDYKEDNYIIYKAKIYGETEIKTWILGMGSNAEVLEPESFKEKIREEIKKTLEIYK
ncbi:helix-turn-helix transcriptional regulator [Clostridium sp. ZS2-4]|uniref:helix-turn-helix transcriptional regulator n=1 Tax=Clostridium sp. ZS2-4 TaxID=2987703 RepID=UPI002279F984|nr:WYL domain-containing transcriptional regulator [Clostridium sp. ZS2-4]MCY6354760.1 WYL domain-containing transcriptional regulator [Clostridium sp. ZS2-4]